MSSCVVLITFFLKKILYKEELVLLLGDHELSLGSWTSLAFLQVMLGVRNLIIYLHVLKISVLNELRNSSIFKGFSRILKLLALWTTEGFCKKTNLVLQHFFQSLWSILKSWNWTRCYISANTLLNNNNINFISEFWFSATLFLVHLYLKMRPWNRKEICGTWVLYHETFTQSHL